MINLIKNVFCLVVLTFCSCSSVNNFYQGRVLDEKGNPLSNVIVAEDDIKRQTKTDKYGYFKLDRSPNWLGHLIFIKEGYRTDTIPTVWHQAGENTEYHFIKNDATVIRMQKLNK